MKKALLVITAAIGMLYARANRNTGSMNGLPVPAGNPPATTVIADYITAIGGEEEVKKIKTVQINGVRGSMESAVLHRNGKPDSSVNVYVWQGKILIEQMAPNKFLTTFNTDSSFKSLVHLKMVFDGKSGFTLQNGTRSALAADQLARFKIQAYPILQLQYLSDPSIKLENKGMEKIKGQDCYKILVSFPGGGGSRMEYYAVKNKLLLRSVGVSTGPTTTTDYMEYNPVGPVLFSCVQEIRRDGSNPVVLRATNIRLNAGVSGSDFNL